MTTTVKCGGAAARVKAAERYVGTLVGGGNVERREVEVAGHALAGTWDGDARHDTVCRIGRDHPLARAVRLVARAQGARREYLTARGAAAPAGMAAELEADRRAKAAAWSAAKAAVEADETARAIAAW